MAEAGTEAETAAETAGSVETEPGAKVGSVAVQADQTWMSDGVQLLMLLQLG